MKWEEIDGKAKRVVMRLFGRMVEPEEEENRREEKKVELLVHNLFENNLLELEASRRSKYDYRKAFRQIQREGNRRMIWRISAVACSIALLLGGVWLFRGTESENGHREGVPALPVAHRVMLKLSDGKQMALDVRDSLQFEEGNKTIQATQGRLAYLQGQSDKEVKSGGFNTLTIPRGAEYKVTLADGTVVHLNADSELKYPVHFSQDKREVYLRGEGWFEVAKDTSCPFYVMADDIQIRVYGTCFNVNTHKISTVQTVLVEGSIGLSAKGVAGEVRIKPGQLAEYERGHKQVTVQEVDVRQYTAWKEGIFYFNDETLEDIMDELARWYDMEVFFRTDQAKKLHFSGHVARYNDIRKILNTITESTGIIFEINEKTIIIK